MGDLLFKCTDKTQFICRLQKKIADRGITSSGSSLPGTQAGEYAALFYADMVLEGEKKGGAKGYFLQAGGWIGGLFASLWTPETANFTTLTLATAGAGALASAGRLGGASLPVMRTLQVGGSLQGGLSAGQAITGEDLNGEKLSTSSRILHGAMGAISILTIAGLQNPSLFGVKSSLFGRANHRPGLGAGRFNQGSVRLGWSWRGNSLVGGGQNYFSLHGGGKFQGINQGPHWHLYLNRFWPSGPGQAPAGALAIIRGGQTFGVLGSGLFGYEMGNAYFNNDK